MPTPPKPIAPLRKLRLSLTAWYVATFGAILVLLGGGLFLAVRHQLARQLDDSLRDATTELARAARIREMESASAHGQVVDAVEELHIPDRTLFLLDTMGRPVKPAAADPWIRAAGRSAGESGSVDAEHDSGGDKTLRLHAERFTLANGTPLVALAVADIVELEDRYASLIAAFGGAAAVGLLLVTAGGWFLVRKSTRPVEHNIEHMRRFMADAAHELRTPLTVLRSRAEIALQQPREAQEYAAALGGIESEARRLGGIVEDLLMLARADAGERPMDRRRVYLDDLTIDAVGAARAVGEAKGVSLRLEEFEEAVVDGDPALLRQLVMILLDNAVKFSAPKGDVRVRVGSTADRPTLTVADAGIGIPGEQLPRIFERFYRGDPARTRGDADGVRRDGAGLGLSIAKWIADAHGAEIVVTSAPGEGTRVAVSFPPPAQTLVQNGVKDPR